MKRRRKGARITRPLALIAVAALGCSSSPETPEEQATPAAPMAPLAPLSAAEQAKLHARFDGKDQEAASSIGMRFRLIFPGTFKWEAGAATVKRPFYLGVHEVTQAQYERVTGENPSHFRGPDLPVDSVVWPEVLAFCRKLSELEGAEYRPPTEAEWHLACRASAGTRFCWGDTLEAAGDYAWHGGNSGQQTHPVGLKKPNAWGLHDMHGNVSEWCQAVPEQFPASGYLARVAGQAPARLSGDSWLYGASSCDDHRHRSCGNRLPTHGFRVARLLP